VPAARTILWAAFQTRWTNMRKLMVAAGAAALLAASTISAFAAEATGAISSIDTTAGTVTLEDGTVYVLPAGFDAATISVGDQVKITYDEADGKMTATMVEPAS
jgi:hypothetical protein